MLTTLQFAQIKKECQKLKCTTNRTFLSLFIFTLNICTIQQAYDGITHARGWASWNWWWRKVDDDDGDGFPSLEPQTDSRSALPRGFRAWRRLRIIKRDDFFSLIFFSLLIFLFSGIDIIAFVSLSNLSFRILFNFEPVILLFKFLIASETDLYIFDGLNFLFNSFSISFNSLVFLMRKFLAFFNVCFLWIFVIK